MLRKNLLIFSLFLNALSVPCTMALDSDATQEITIHSDSAQFDRKTGTAIYTGQVVLEQGTLKITADQITLHSNEEKKLTQAIALGQPAHFQQQMEDDKGLTKAQGGNITYLTLDKNITLLDNATLEQEDNVFTGETIIYNMLDETVSAKGGTQTELAPKSDSEIKPSRVKMIIQPASTEPEQTEPEKTEQPSTEKVLPSEDA
ncbi:MAG TPA: lipopolysaccharide transport periplasmic protein LptA [Oceanospirillales bacterium]|nr:lipopolysaccharide transport periplasmic protein LptA [Oleispira sp.]HCM06268.1 lipopolysaccharide transport periplasmic protein LptA [Oceanospirillales bacterium]|tara:strand:- start:6045 stop:6653 length:609 start_codon:yes stop_codon:yes gene_type:complete